MKFSFGVILLFLVAFDPQVPGLPNGVGFTLVVSIFLFVPVLLKLSNLDAATVFFFNKASPVCFLFVLAFAFICLRLLLNGGANVGFSLSWIKALFVFLSALFVFVIFYANRSPEKFVFSLVVIFATNALINFFAGSFDQFSGFLELFHSDPVNEVLGKNPYRDSFLSGSGYFSVGTAYGLAVLLFAFYVVRSGSSNIFLAASIVLSSIAGFVAARTSFFAVFFSFLYLLKHRPFFFVAFSILATVFIWLILGLPQLQPYKLWMWSFFRFASDPSGSHLISQMYFWPGVDVFIIGNGAVNDGSFPYTDSGYMQDILFGGLFFLLIKLSFVFVFVFKFFRNNPLFVLFVAASVLAFQFKGLFVYNNAQGMAVFYFIYFYLASIDFRLRLDNG